MTSETTSPSTRKRSLEFRIFDILLVFVLLAGGYLRLVGTQWGEYQYLHPDERFLIWVGSDIQPPDAPPERLGAPPTASMMPWRANYPIWWMQNLPGYGNDNRDRNGDLMQNWWILLFR